MELPYLITVRNSECLRRVGSGWRSMMEMTSYPSNVGTALEEGDRQSAVELDRERARASAAPLVN